MTQHLTGRTYMEKEPSFRGSEMVVHTGGVDMEEQICLHHVGSKSKSNTDRSWGKYRSKGHPIHCNLLPLMKPYFLLLTTSQEGHHVINPLRDWSINSESLWSNHLWKHQHRRTQKCAPLIPWVFLNPIKLLLKLTCTEKWDCSKDGDKYYRAIKQDTYSDEKKQQVCCGVIHL